MKINNLGQTQYTQAKKQPQQKEADGMPQDAVILGSTPQDDAPAVKKWTFMHYAAGDNNLDRYIQGDVKEMETVGSDANTNIVAMLDLTRGRGAKTYYVTQDTSPKPGTELTSPVLAEHGVINMADPKVLAKFIVDTVKKFPAEHYMLDIGNHGGGWSGAVSDDSSGGWMETPQIKQALDMAQKETGVKLDIVGFDCCQMGNTEVAYELKDNANFMIGSEANEGGLGWNYNDVLKEDPKGVRGDYVYNAEGEPVAGQRHSYNNLLLSPEVLGGLQRALKNKINLDPKEFAFHLVEAAELHQNDLPTMSATDLTKMKDISGAADGLAKSILATDTPNSTLKSIASKTQDISGNRDFFHFAELITKDDSITDKKLKEAAQGVMDAITGGLVNEEHSSRYPNAHGLTVEIPKWGGIAAKYDNLQFAQDVPDWKKAMEKMNK